MTAAPALALPGSRVLLGWWRELAELAPRRLWFAHLLLHRVEACVEVEETPLHPVSSALLPLLAAPRAAEELARELHLDLALLSWLLGRLHAAHLVEPAGAAWQLTAAGRESLQRGAGTGRPRRCVFWFADHSPPIYLPLRQPPAQPLTPPADWAFDPAHLEACVQQPGFPRDVRRVLPPDGQDPGRVILDRAEQLWLALVETAAGVRGFGVRPDNWQMQREPEVLALDSAAPLAALGGEPTAEAWRQAWQAWCQPRGVPLSEIEACKLEPEGHLLRVAAPPRLIERLRSGRSEALRGEAWLLAGGERVRAAAQLDLHEAR